jgi:SAM-dependent methyltransferase
VVVALERDARTLARARARATEAELHNIDFVQTDIDEYTTAASFDALVGRYILQFLPDPTATLRALTQSLRSGGIVAFQEGSWTPFVALSKHLPLWSSAVALLHEHAARAGADLEMGPNLHRVFQDAGLPAPRMRLEMELGYQPEFTRWVSDSLRSVLPQVKQFGLSHEALGDLETLQERLSEEVAQSRTVVPWLGLVAAWSRKP